MRLFYIVILFVTLSIILDIEAASANSGPLSFDEALDKIMQYDTPTRSQKHYTLWAEKDELSKSLLFRPKVSLDYSFNHSFQSNDNTNTMNFNAQLNLFSFGADWKKWQASKAQLQANQWKEKRLLPEQENSAALILLESVSAQKNLQILQLFQKRKEEILQSIQQRFQKGLVPSYELTKAKVDLNNAQAKTRDGEIFSNSKQKQVESLIGDGQKIEIETKWPWQTKMNQQFMDEFIKRPYNIDKIPSIQEAKWQVTQYEHTMESTQRSFWPSLDFGYQHGWNHYGQKNTQNTAIISLTIPLFDSLTTTTSLQLDRANYNSSRYKAEQIKREGQASYNHQKEILLLAWSTYQHRKENYKLSKNLYDENFKRFQGGRISINELAIDQDRYFDSEQLLVSGTLQLTKAMVEHCGHLGEPVSSCLAL